VDELTRRQMLKVTGAAAATIAASLQGPAPTPRPGTAERRQLPGTTTRHRLFSAACPLLVLGPGPRDAARAR
jgi:hypothetical protein